MERKLTAILSVDVHGYSRLMGTDEGGTLRTPTAYPTSGQPQRVAPTKCDQPSAVSLARSSIAVSHTASRPAYWGRWL